MPQDTTPLLNICHRPPVTVSPASSARDAARRMTESGVGAVAVVDEGLLVGILTERDLLTKITDRGLDPGAHFAASIMTSDPHTLPPDGGRKRAVDVMTSNHVRHLPIVSEAGELLGMLSMRHLLRHQLRRLRGEVRSLTSYMGADGPGG